MLCAFKGCWNRGPYRAVQRCTWGHSPILREERTENLIVQSTTILAVRKLEDPLIVLAVDRFLHRAGAVAGKVQGDLQRIDDGVVMYTHMRLSEQLEKLYAATVPAAVREYLGEKNGTPVRRSAARPRRAAPSAGHAEGNQPAE